ncbi:MAG: hypothetical protein WC634_03805 [archaeon]
MVKAVTSGKPFACWQKPWEKTPSAGTEPIQLGLNIEKPLLFLPRTLQGTRLTWLASARHESRHVRLVRARSLLLSAIGWLRQAKTLPARQSTALKALTFCRGQKKRSKKALREAQFFPRLFLNL